MIPEKPRVSIGMPVFNGENYLKEAIDSILTQTYSNFELVISDNASTDSTRQICLEYAAQDKRIRFFRNDRNIGAAKNGNRVFELSSGEYFRWAAHDDMIAPDYLLKCVALLDQDPSIVVCHSKVKIIGEGGQVLRTFEIDLSRLNSLRPEERFGNLICTDQWCFEIFGLMRSSVLRKTRLFGTYVSSDTTLRAELGLLGRFHIIPEYMFFSRDHHERSVRAYGGHHSRGAWFDPANEGRIVLPHWRILFEYARCLKRISLTGYQKTACYFSLGAWVLHDWNWAWMILNLVVAAFPKSWDYVWKLKQLKKRFFRSATTID
jgi:glycosyltransferase involved in cell wall biosynthesis